MTPQYRPLTTALEPIDMAVGDTGSAVSYLQSALQQLAYYEDDVDGQYGEKTADAVAQVQRYYGFKVTGSYGADTWYALSFWAPEQRGWTAPGAVTFPDWMKGVRRVFQLIASDRKKAAS